MSESAKKSFQETDILSTTSARYSNVDPINAQIATKVAHFMQERELGRIAVFVGMHRTTVNEAGDDNGLELSLQVRSRSLIQTRRWDGVEIIINRGDILKDIYGGLITSSSPSAGEDSFGIAVRREWNEAMTTFDALYSYSTKRLRGVKLDRFLTDPTPFLDRRLKAMRDIEKRKSSGRRQ